jgi:anaerobic magnesium-protoporphyrin IX monomethyl ester cyclase
MRILLTTLNAKYIHVNLAIRILYELNRDRKGLEWKEFTIKEDKDEVAGFCKDFDVVAFSCYIWNITQTLEVIKKIKAINPNIKVLLGGPEVSYDWDDVISVPEVDYIIAGEGEIPFGEFLDQYPSIENVSNLVRKENGVVLHTPKNVSFDVKDLATIHPYRNDDPATLANRVLYIETSRGCPYKCEFCLASLDNKVRYLPMENIKATLLYLMQHGRVVKFLDRTFNIKKDFTLEIFNFILENHRPGNVFQFEITADILHPDIIKFINEKVPKGLFRFEIGIQSVNQKANLEVSRKQSFEKTVSIIKQVENKVELHLDLIVGLPLDHFADTKHSFEETFRLFAPELQLGFLKFLKGTPVRDKYEKYGFEFDKIAPYQIIKSDYLSAEELSRIVKLEHALEIYWNKPRAINTLKYVTAKYSIFDFLEGLGTYFGTKREYHKYTLNDIYEILDEFASKNYREDRILKELIAVDYYLQHKVKPKTMFLEEVSREEKNTIIAERKLNHHKFRFIIVQLSFDYGVFRSEQGAIINGNHILILQYNGTDLPEVVAEKPALELNW